MVKLILPITCLLLLITGCSQQPNGVTLKNTQPHSVFVLCPDVNGFALRESCHTSRLTPITNNNKTLKSEPIVAPTTLEDKQQKTLLKNEDFIVYFADNKYIPNNEQQKRLNHWLKNNASVKNKHLVVTAHTSANGSLKHNTMLAEARLISIKELLNKHGIKQVTSVIQPQCCRTGESEALMSLDRKVVLSIQ